MTLSSFEAAPLRFVHDVVTGEFISLGVVLLCPQQRFLGSRFVSSFRRVKAAFPDLDRVHVGRVCAALAEAVEDERSRCFDQLPFGRVLSLGDVLDRLVPPNDGTLQFPPTIAAGITRDPERTLNELFQRYTSRHREAPVRVTRGDEDVWRPWAAQLRQQGLLRYLQPRVLQGDHRVELPLRHAWRNGSWNAVQPLSFDLADPREIRDRAILWAERLRVVRPADQDTNLSLLLGLPSHTRPKNIREAATDAHAILEERVREQAMLVPEDEGDRIVSKIAADIAAHPA